MKKLAPYGHLLSSPQIVIIFMGLLSCERAASFQQHLPYTLCLPPNTSPTNFIWPINNSEVYLVDTSASSLSFIKFCVTCFFSYGAREVHYISSNFEKDFLHE